MITKSEWQEWKEETVTKQLVELLKVGKITSMEDLMALRGEVGDFPRGAGFAYDEVLEIVRLGDGLYEEE